MRSRITNPGDKVTINYLRDGKKKSVKVELGKMPSMSNDLNMHGQGFNEWIRKR